MKLSLEIFTTRRSSWLTRREDALQADAMPVFPSAEDDTETEAATSRRGSRTAEGQWGGAEGAGADVDEDGDEDGDDRDFEHYHSDGEDRPGLGGFAKGDPEVGSGSETPCGKGGRFSPSSLVEENTETETEQDPASGEPYALRVAAQKRSSDGEAGALGMGSRSSSGSRGRRQ